MASTSLRRDRRSSNAHRTIRVGKLRARCQTRIYLICLRSPVRREGGAGTRGDAQQPHPPHRARRALVGDTRDGRQDHEALDQPAERHAARHSPAHSPNACDPDVSRPQNASAPFLCSALGAPRLAR